MFRTYLRFETYKGVTKCRTCALHIKSGNFDPFEVLLKKHRLKICSNCLCTLKTGQIYVRFEVS